MKNNRTVFISLFIILVSATCAGATATDSLIRRLDSVIENRGRYIKEKENRMSAINRELRTVVSDEKRFMLLSGLLDEYRSYNTDSALNVAKDRLEVARRMPGRPDYLDNAVMNIADIYGMAGMYKEALDLMSRVSAATLPDYLDPYYYHIYRTIYGLMADYSISEDLRMEYRRLTDRYRDSLMMVKDKASLPYILTQSDQYNANGEYDKAIAMLTDYYRGMKTDNIHDVAIVAYTLSVAYRMKGDTANEKLYLIISAIADLQSATREYISLARLAVLLYREGDTERSYKYLRTSMEDAAKCNARLRILEVNGLFPVVNDVYIDRIQQQTRLKVSVVAISILSLLLLLALFYVYKQMKRLAAARREVIKSNERLQQMNLELKEYNGKLTEANHMITENSHLKEEYIGRYMDQCSVYIDKLDQYRKQIGRLLNADKLTELKKQIKSTSFLDEELKAFYDNFDKTFLQLFPTFVDDFNALLAEDERIIPKAEGSLTTELRIFALIRLGITDSVKIARFLRYSVTTIYNYRTKVRNKAAGDRDRLEVELMKIGRA